MKLVRIRDTPEPFNLLEITDNRTNSGVLSGGKKKQKENTGSFFFLSDVALKVFKNELSRVDF